MQGVTLFCKEYYKCSLAFTQAYECPKTTLSRDRAISQYQHMSAVCMALMRRGDSVATIQLVRVSILPAKPILVAGCQAPSHITLWSTMLISPSTSTLIVKHIKNGTNASLCPINTLHTHLNHIWLQQQFPCTVIS